MTSKSQFIHHKDGNIRKNELVNLELFTLVSDDEKKHLVNQNQFNNDNIIAEDSGKELTQCNIP
jgi:hypothetical protein